MRSRKVFGLCIHVGRQADIELDDSSEDEDYKPTLQKQSRLDDYLNSSTSPSNGNA